MSKKLPSPPPEEEMTEQEWLLEIAATIAHALQLLKEAQRITTRRDDLGVTISAYFNWRSVVKIDLSRQDKESFFAEPFPVDLKLRKNMASSTKGDVK